MGSMRLFAFLFFASLVVGALSGSIYSVKDNGAIGDGETDDAKAFLDTWNKACADSTAPTVLVPSGYTFLVDQVSFQGPCNSLIHVQIDGTILSPNRIRAIRENHWISFKTTNGLVINGTGTMDGQGAIWWDYRANTTTHGPTIMVISNCTNVQLSGLYFKDSPMVHLGIQRTVGANVNGITITTPGDTPGTDGVHVSRSQNISITNSTIGTGDDCISIETDTFNLSISHIICGPGHGISIGSLGTDDSEASVGNVHVSECSFNGSTNGVRIKTAQGGSGYVKGIIFEHINCTAVYNPIIIDQYYGGGPNKTSAVQVSGVTYRNIFGTSATSNAITLSCSQTMGCKNIILDNIYLQSQDPGQECGATCTNAEGLKIGTVFPAVPCLAQA